MYVFHLLPIVVRHLDMEILVGKKFFVSQVSVSQISTVFHLDHEEHFCFTTKHASLLRSKLRKIVFSIVLNVIYISVKGRLILSTTLI